MAVIKRMSLVDQVYEKLKDKIVQLKIPFGSKLNVSKLQEEYGVSSTPVREEGLIEFENNVGARVIDITEDDVRKIQEVSFAYEMAAARYAMKRGDREGMIREIGQYIEEYKNSHGVIESCSCIRNIKTVFYKNSDNEMLIDSMESLNGLDQVLHSLFSMPREKGGSGEFYHTGISYFETIYEAIQNDDFAGVCDGLEGHQLWARKYIVKNLETVKERQNQEYDSKLL